jgi:pilus assembly protein CpaE
MAKQIALVFATDRQPEELLRAAGMHVTNLTESGLGLLAVPSAKQPDAVIIDLRGGAGIPVALSALTRHHPDTGLVVIAATLEPKLLVEAMRAGVNEVVSEPFDQSDLEKAITRVTGQRAAADAGEVLGFVGAKGGVGTTTVAVNMATMLGQLVKPERTLIVDLHQSGGDASVFTGTEPRFSVQDAIDNTHRLDESFLRTLVTQIGGTTDLLASPERPTVNRLDTDKARRIIALASSAYKYTVLDLPRSDGGVLDALDQLTAIYIVVNQELATVKSASRMAGMLRQRYGREKLKVVLSRSDRQADIGHADVEKAIGLSVAHTFPSDYRVALNALNKGRPLALDNQNELSASFRQFAQEVSGVRPKREGTKSPGLFGRLTQRRADA